MSTLVANNLLHLKLLTTTHIWSFIDEVEDPMQTKQTFIYENTPIQIYWTFHHQILK